jgi:adenine/guanine phosphoribosyltransferase-like PRPP-binding protein
MDAVPTEPNLILDYLLDTADPEEARAIMAMQRGGECPAHRVARRTGLHVTVTERTDQPRPPCRCGLQSGHPGCCQP